MDFADKNQQGQKSRFDCLLFDLDDTLYPLSIGFQDLVTKNIQVYMVQKLGIEESKLTELGNLLYKNYGTTMAGLRAVGYDLDYDDYHSFVHGTLPYDNLKPDPILRGLLLSLPIRKLIFTNGDKIHATKALNKLGLEDCFEGIICFETLNPVKKNTIPRDDGEFRSSGLTTPSTKRFDIIGHFSQPQAGSILPRTPVVCKPSESAIEVALKIANLDPQRTMFFDDSVRNIQSGKSVGLHTVLVGTSNRVKGADFSLESIHNIKEILPELWEADDNFEKIGYRARVVIETPVIA